MDEDRLDEAESVLKECYDRVQSWDFSFWEYPEQRGRVELACTMGRMYAMMPPSAKYQKEQAEKLYLAPSELDKQIDDTGW